MENNCPDCVHWSSDLCNRCVDKNRFKKPDQTHEAVVRLNDLLVRIPCTKDGKPILWGDTVYIANPDGAPWEDGYVLPVKVESIMIGCHFEEYDGTHTIMAGDNECGNLECYSACELVPAEY